MSGVDTDTLQKQLRERDELLAFIAHELRNPLHTLGMQLASARAALKAEAPAEGQSLARLRKAQRTLAQYVERVTLLLDLAQQNGDAFVTHLADFDLGQMLAGLPQRFADDADFYGSRLRYDGLPSLVISSDAQAIEHIVHNLLSNALKYAAAQQIVISLDAGMDEVCIVVADDGVGIPLEQQSVIFEKFQRGHLDPKASGFGLGLWIVSRLVQALGGRVALASEPGRGCSFTVALPGAAAPLGTEQESS